MTNEDYKYLLAERTAIMVENGETELQATQQARREVRDMLKGELGTLEANVLVMKFERGEI